MDKRQEMILKYGQAVEYLPPRIRGAAMKLSDDDKVSAEEFRLRTGREPTVYINGIERPIGLNSEIRHEELTNVLEIATRSSVHAAADSIKNGFVTVSGGHRIALCGTAVNGNGGMYIRDLSSVSVRIAKQIYGCSDEVYDGLFVNKRFKNTLIISPPGNGKTTLLRDLVRRISDGGRRISLVDERGEIAAKHRGVPQFDVGEHTDVLDGMEKASGALLMLRNMSPDIIAMDEITADVDAEAIVKIAYCGVGILATAHGDGVESVFAKPLYRRLYDIGIFKTAVSLRRSGVSFTYKLTEL